MNITVEIKGIQRMDGETADSYVFAEGTLEHLPKATRLTYTEKGVDGERDAVTVLTISETLVTIRRHGDTASHLILKKGERRENPYETPYGTFALGVTAHRIEWKSREHGGRLLLSYSLDMNGIPASENELEITFKEVS